MNRNYYKEPSLEPREKKEICCAKCGDALTYAYLRNGELYCEPCIMQVLYDEGEVEYIALEELPYDAE